MKESRYVKLARTMLNVLIKARILFPVHTQEEQSYLHCMAAYNPSGIKAV